MPPPSLQECLLGGQGKTGQARGITWCERVGGAHPDLENAAFGFFPLAGIFTLAIGVLIIFQFARTNLTHQIKENLLSVGNHLLENTKRFKTITEGEH